MRFSRMVLKITMAAALAVPMAVMPVAQAHAGVFISVAIAPPALPVYAQPVIPGDGYIWTPGYWAYGDEGYYWVPGVWVLAPEPGLLWTPGYWGFERGYYGWHAGYWGPHVGFYGGVNYGFGYGGVGFFGGEWRGGHFFYNTAAGNFGGAHITNVYVNREVIVHNTIINNNHTSFNGPGGIVRQPSPEESRFANERHVQPTANQMSHEAAARQDRSQLASVNHGRPATMAASNVNAYHPGVNQREGNQNQRIANGEKDGNINSRQAARDDQKQANVDRQVANDRAANGGKLNQPERQQVNKEQNRDSRQIARQNHPAPKAESRPAPRPEPKEKK